MRISATVALALILPAVPALAQDETAARKMAVEAARVPLEQPVTRAPYSAESSTESVQALADGNRIVRKTTGRVYRDSEGRTRREQDGQYIYNNRVDNRVTMNRATGVSIVDPVEGYSYSLNPVEKIAWRTPLGTSAAIFGKVEAAQVEERRRAETQAAMDEIRVAIPRSGGAVTPADEQKVAEARPRVAAGAGGRGGSGFGGGGGEVRMRGSAESFKVTPGPLERKTLEGVLVEGRKTTSVIPAGQVGNEQPLTILSEEWRSPDLNVLVMTHHSDPRTGESTYRLTNIVRAEPDRSLFMVPPDYEIRDSGVRKMLEAKK